MNYIGIDGNVHNDSLMHWKYIKKIKSGSGWRYFYTPEEIRAYYKEEQGKANAQYEAKEAYSNKIQREHRKDNKFMYEARKRGIRDKLYFENGKLVNNLYGSRKDRKKNDATYRRINREIDNQRKIAKASHKIERKLDPIGRTAKSTISKPINEAKKDVKDVKDYYKWQEKKANKRYKKEQKEIKEITKGAREWNKVYSQEGGYGDNSRAKGKAISVGITAGSKGAKTISSIRRSATPKINTGKAIVNRTLKKELNAERKRREAARKRKTANRVASKTSNVSKNISKALSTGVKKNETRKNRSGNKSYKMYNRW